MPSEKAIREENLKIRQLRFIVDLTSSILYQQDLSLKESLELIEKTKKLVLDLFPDKEDAFELIYRSRFQRIVKEKFFINGLHN